jgi:hypothetical protein
MAFLFSFVTLADALPHLHSRPKRQFDSVSFTTGSSALALDHIQPIQISKIDTKILAQNQKISIFVGITKLHKNY